MLISNIGKITYEYEQVDDEESPLNELSTALHFRAVSHRKTGFEWSRAEIKRKRSRVKIANWQRESVCKLFPDSRNDLIHWSANYRQSTTRKARKVT
jgi:hypothetical protein